MKFRQIVALLISIVSLVLPLHAQYEPTAGSIASEHFQDGQAAILATDFQRAIRHFEKALKAQPDLVVAKRLIGQCYAFLGKYPEATNYYLQVVKADSMFSRYLYFELGDTYYKMGQAELALDYFNTFDRLQDTSLVEFGLHSVAERAEELIGLDRLQSNIRACQNSLDSVKFINVTEIVNLGKAINSKEDDYFPFLTNDQLSLYYTRKTGTADEDLLYSEWRNESWKKGEKIKATTTDTPEGMPTLVRNGRQLFFTACSRESVAGPCDIWEAVVDADHIERINPLQNPLNSEYWESQAAVSCDGRQLFFASNRPGGLGGTDLYMSERLPGGNWGPPVNLGAPVNTPEDEEAPFISNDGQTLYFSSTGHLGLGEQDIFMAWWDERLQRWSTPINLGPPVNGPHRELGFYLSANGKMGFFASNRPGGEGGMDIYRFELDEKLFGEPITFVEGVVKDSVLLSPIAATVQINGRAPVITDEEGRFFLCAGADEMLDLRLAVDTYRPYHNQFAIPHWENRTSFPLEVLLRPQHSFLADIEEEENNRPPREKPAEFLVRHSILFDFDSAELTQPEIERMIALVASLEGRNIQRVEIVGFSDDIGAQTYNLQLSEDRAKHVAVFLLNRAIDVDDIHIEGKGTVQNDRPREENRRVEIKITLIE